MSAPKESNQEPDNVQVITAAAYAARLYLELENLPPEDQVGYWDDLRPLLCEHQSPRFDAWVIRFLATANRKRAEALAKHDEGLELTAAFYNPDGEALDDAEIAEVGRLMVEAVEIEQKRSGKRLGAMNRRELIDWITQVAKLDPLGGTNHDKFRSPINNKPIGIPRHVKSYGRGFRLGILRQAGKSPQDVSEV